jgi:[acyl-carrier-protein] S-malonyltransferase
MRSDPTCALCVGQGAPVDATTAESVMATVPMLMDELSRLGLEDCFERAAASTAHAQPAIYCATVASSRRLDGVERISLAAGHSLGEYAALVIAGALEPVDGLRLVALRGRLMQHAAERFAPNGMLAVRAGVTEVEAALDGHAGGVTIANDNGPRQVVLAGDLTELDEIVQRLRARGMRATRLKVSGAFHHPFMAPAVEEMRRALEEVDFRAPAIPVVSGFSAAPFADIACELLAGITSRVRWREVMQYLLDAGAKRFIDLGPGEVLANLAAKVAPDVECVGVAALSA